MEKTLPDTATHVEGPSNPPSSVDDFDIVDKSAVGGRDISELPPKYYWSWSIIGSVLVRCSCMKFWNP